MKIDILGYIVNAQSIKDCIDDVYASLQKSQSCIWLACFNPHSYVLACSEEVFSEALKDANWLVPDGIGVLIASHLIGEHRLKQERPFLCKGVQMRVTGSDIFFGLQKYLNDAGGYSVFFLGGTNETLSTICEQMASDYPNIRVAGVYSPPFKPEYSPAEVDEMINTINESKADVLWIGMTAPKQEKWIYQNKNRLNVRFAAAIGAVFDFYTGNIKRSHPLFQRFGMEWLPRLLQEPRRLWRRMGVSAPIFMYHILLTLVRKYF